MRLLDEAPRLLSIAAFLNCGPSCLLSNGRAIFLLLVNLYVLISAIRLSGTA